MQNDETGFPQREKHQAKGCLLLIATVVLVFLALVIAGIASIIVVDTVRLRGEGYTFSRRVERYKVACQFLWFDFKEAVSRKSSESAPVEPEVIQCPADPPESESEPAMESEPDP
ncbi:MAG: hypothetical protein J6Y92_02565 [Lentisphaeria bacterium]|nr:hypothetical protein [Lentisphaeria bacterium]